MTCSRAGARHDMRDAVPPCEMRYRGEAGTGRRNLSRRRPDRPRHPTRRSRRARPPPPTHPEAIRADRHQRPSRSTSSKPPLNNLPGSAARRSAEYQRFSSRTPMESRPLQQIWTTGATADLSGATGVAPPDRKLIHRAVMRVRGGGARDHRRAHGGALLLGPLACGWTTYVRLDHLRAVGPPYFVNQVVQRNVSGPTAFKWSKQIGGVTTCETPSHHVGRPVGRSRCGTPEPPRRRPVRLR